PLSQLRTDIPAGLDAVLERMLAKDPRERYRTPAEVAAALAPFVDGQSQSTSTSRGEGGFGSRKSRWLIGSAGALVLTVVVAAIFWPRDATLVPVKVVPVAPEKQAIVPTQPAPRPTAAEQARIWLKSNSAFGPEHRLVSETADYLDEKGPSGKAF